MLDFILMILFMRFMSRINWAIMDYLVTAIIHHIISTALSDVSTLNFEKCCFTSSSLKPFSSQQGNHLTSNRYP